MRRRQLAVAAGVAGLAAVAAVGWVRGARAGGHAPTPCAGLERGLDGVWDPAVRTAMRGRFTASGRAYGEDTFRRAAAALDGYARGWVAMRRDACEATAVRHAQSEHVLDLRMACLDRRAGEVRALTTLFATSADGEVVDHAITAIHDLPPVAACADADALAKAVPPPPGRAAEVASLWARLDAVRAQERAGRYVARALTNLCAVLTEAGRYADARAAGERALAIKLAVLGPDHPDVASTLTNLGSAAYQGGDYPSALAYHQRALAIDERVLGTNHPRVANALTNVGDADELLGR